MKKAFTMIELTIAIALLSTIMVAVFSIYMTATKNYRVQSQKTYLQKEMNITGDALADEMKLAANVQQASQGRTLSNTTLILSLPAVDENGNFVYTEGFLEFDTFIYAKEENKLRKIVIPSANSNRGEKDFIVLTDISNVNFSYSPDTLNPLSITATIEVTRIVSKNHITIRSERSAFLRNKQ